MNSESNTTSADLEGCWEMVRAEFDGETAPELVVAKTTLELSGKNYAVRFDREIVDQGEFIAAHAVGHSFLTLNGITGTNQGRTIPAIYQLVRDRLRICYGLAGSLPRGFTTEVGSQKYLATYRRIPRGENQVR